MRAPLATRCSPKRVLHPQLVSGNLDLVGKGQGAMPDDTRTIDPGAAELTQIFEHQPCRGAAHSGMFAPDTPPGQRYFALTVLADHRVTPLTEMSCELPSGSTTVTTNESIVRLLLGERGVSDGVAPSRVSRGRLNRIARLSRRLSETPAEPPRCLRHQRGDRVGVGIGQREHRHAVTHDGIPEPLSSPEALRMGCADPCVDWDSG